MFLPVTPNWQSALSAWVRRALVTCCWSLWFGVFLGCGGSGETPTTPSSATASDQDKDRSAHDAGADAPQATSEKATEDSEAVGTASDNAKANEIAAPLPLLERTAAAPTAGDPAAEGWDGEAFSELALKQLQEIGAALESSANSDEVAASWKPLLTTSFEAEPLVPSQLRIVLEDAQIRIERATWSEEEAHPTTSDVDAVLAPLVERFASLPHRKTKFKLFRVEASNGQPRTRQYFHLSGHGDDQAVECNTTWVVDWEAGPKGSLPKVRRIHLEQFELVTAKWRGGPWLADATASLLRHQVHLPPLLQYGIDHWEARLDRSCGVFNFGYHGIAVGDVNGDLLDDVYVCETGGLPNHLLVQQPDGSVKDTASQAHVDYLDNTRSALLVDLDNDRDADLILAMVTGLVFLENDGQGVFTERAKIPSLREAMSLAAADYDQNGFLDVYVCVYYGQNDEAVNLPLPVPYFNATNGGKNHLISNRGNWQFNDATDATGLDEGNNRFSFAATWEDDDRDGDLDLLVVNDFGPNQLYRNEGGRFRNVAQEAGLVDGAFGMSATRADYDHDGDQDIYVSNMFSAAGNRVTFDPRFKADETPETRAKFQHLARGNSLFRNRDDGTYEDVSVPMQVTMGRWSWGSLFFDINNDSWDDLLVANGFVTGRQQDDL